jgi:hypothetical protein
MVHRSEYVEMTPILPDMCHLSITSDFYFCSMIHEMGDIVDVKYNGIVYDKKKIVGFREGTKEIYILEVHNWLNQQDVIKNYTKDKTHE